VYAFLNVDSMTDPEAFEQESIVLAEAFGQHAALLLHEAHLRAQVHAASRTDALTGLPNRRAFMEVLTQEKARARQHGHPLSLLLADIRAFRALNDDHGHLVGDQVLFRVAGVLRHALAPGDPTGGAAKGGPFEVARWGGDEFALLLPEIDLAGAQVVMDSIRSTMQRTAVAGQTIELNFGVATLTAGDPDGMGMIRTAETALSRDKQLVLERSHDRERRARDDLAS
jgi:diguanylate cyclase (GGDEF)-like protein